MILYSSIYYLFFMTVLLTVDVIFLTLSIKTRSVWSISFLVFLQFLCIMLYELHRELVVMYQGEAFPLTHARIGVLLFEHYIYGFASCKVIDYVETHWSKTFRRAG